jgi:small-conductance mechanosensitive channel
MGLKTTKVKNWAGDIKIISNGNIGDLINYSLTDTVFSIDIDISYDEDIDHAIEVLNKEMPLRMIHCKDLLVAPKAAGVSELADSGVRIRIFATTPAEKQYAVSRDLLKVCKQILDDYKIEIPYNHLVVETVKSDSHD